MSRTASLLLNIGTSITQNFIFTDIIGHLVSLTFNKESGMCDYPDIEWYRGVVSSVKSVEYNKTAENLNLDYVFKINDDVKVL